MANSESEMKVDYKYIPSNQMEDYEIKEEPLENCETNPNSNFV